MSNRKKGNQKITSSDAFQTSNISFSSFAQSPSTSSTNLEYDSLDSAIKVYIYIYIK